MKVKHPHRALKHQMINKDGDCGQCCLAGITGKSVKEIYDLFGYIDALTYDRMTKFLFRQHIWFENHLPSDKYYDENPQWFTFGKPSWSNFIAWYNLTISRINGGLVGISEVNCNGNAHNDDFTDHWVLIYGFDKKSENATDMLLLISCPTRGEFTIDAKTFLRNYGGYNTIWVEPIAVSNNI